MAGLIEKNGSYELVILSESPNKNCILYVIIHEVHGRMETARFYYGLDELKRYFNNYVNQAIKPPGPAG